MSMSIDRTMNVADVDADGRYRQDMGDLRELAESIERVGLLHPIVVTGDGRLVAGGRRLAAFASLGRDEIPVTVVDSLTDARALLEAERDENTCRVDMKPSERVALGMALEDLERGPAERRRASGLKQNRSENFTERNGQAGETLAIVGAAVGMSRPTYTRAKQVVIAAENNEPGAAEALEQMDETGKVRGAWEKVIAQRNQPDPPRRRNGRLNTLAGLDTAKGQVAAAAHARKYVDMCARLEGMAAAVGAPHMSPEHIAAAMEPAERAQLASKFAQALSGLRKFNNAIQEA